MTRRSALICVVVASLVGWTVSAVARGTASASRLAVPLPASALHRLDNPPFRAPPSTEQCRTIYELACYTPLQIRTAYGVPALLAQGNDGAGKTIAIVASFGSPTIERDLHVFDQTWGLPDPPSLKTITPAGPLPPFDPTDPEMTGWAFETTLDVEYAHLMAPRAAIVVVATPVAESEGVAGFPEIEQAENYVVEHGLADVISQSLGAAEQTFPSSDRLLSLRGALQTAARHGVTVVASSGDSGATGYQNDGQTLFSYPVDSWPATDPLVTSVGGVRLQLTAQGRRTAPDTAWNDGYGAGGGGLSTVFSRPAFQNPVRSVVGEYRGTPDVALSAAVDGGVIVYSSYDADDTGWRVVGGTSEAAPLFAGMVALAAQRAKHRLGAINAALYRLAAEPGNGIVDVTAGDNSYGGVTGYSAGPRYDLVSGLGTIDAARFVPALAKAIPTTKWARP
jgi:subtilase family serine protease